MSGAISGGPGGSKRGVPMAILVAALLASCTMKADPLVPADQPTSVRVEATLPGSGPRPMRPGGAEENPLPFVLSASEAQAITVDLTVLGPSGEPLAFDGWLQLTSQPGTVARVDTPPEIEAIDNHVHVRDGTVEGLRVFITRAFSETRLWAEDLGFVPAAPDEAKCANGMDDDGDGRTDHPADFGCRFANDDTETAGSHAAGVSDVLYFKNPSLQEVQGTADESPLVGNRVSIDTTDTPGPMIVTRVTTDGFYVSELELDDGELTRRAKPRAHGFVFNFSTPPFLRACDEILRVSGGVVEFFGFTEMSFPSWDREIWCSPELDGPCESDEGAPIARRPCPIPEPKLLDGALLGTPAMEDWESALVEIRDVTLPTRFGSACPESFRSRCESSGGACACASFSPQGSNCDLDGNGTVSLEPGLERDCNDACSSDTSCSEWNQFLEFGQFVVETAGSAINVVTRNSVPGFDPTAHRGETFPVFRGTLRHFAPLGAERGYILQPRCEADVVRPGGTPVPAHRSCVSPRTEGPVEPEG